MNPKQELIRKLSEIDNVPFIIELKELLPDILIDIRYNWLVRVFDLNKNWGTYQLIRSNNILYITKPEFNSWNYFQFSIYFGYQGGENAMLYGVTGPWKKKEVNETVKNFYHICENNGFTEWVDTYNNNWMYKYFKKNNDLFIEMIKNNQNPEISIKSFITEFEVFCLKLKDQLEIINEQIRKS